MVNFGLDFSAGVLTASCLSRRVAGPSGIMKQWRDLSPSAMSQSEWRKWRREKARSRDQLNLAQVKSLGLPTSYAGTEYGINWEAFDDKETLDSAVQTDLVAAKYDWEILEYPPPDSYTMAFTGSWEPLEKYTLSDGLRVRLRVSDYGHFYIGDVGVIRKHGMTSQPYWSSAGEYEDVPICLVALDCHDDGRTRARDAELWLGPHLLETWIDANRMDGATKAPLAIEQKDIATQTGGCCEAAVAIHTDTPAVAHIGDSSPRETHDEGEREYKPVSPWVSLCRTGDSGAGAPEQA